MDAKPNCVTDCRQPWKANRIPFTDSLGGSVTMTSLSYRTCEHEGSVSKKGFLMHVHEVQRIMYRGVPYTRTSRTVWYGLTQICGSPSLSVRTQKSADGMRICGGTPDT